MTAKLFALAEVKSLEDTENPNGAFDVILSTPTLDRDDEIIDSGAFDPLPDHITFDVDHGMSTSTTVGSGVPFYDDAGNLRVRGTYSSIPRAQEVRTLVREGHIRTTSVAFMAAKRVEGEDGKIHIQRAELLNGAFVPIPSNRQAIILSSKGYAERTSTDPSSATPITESSPAPAAPDGSAGKPSEAPAVTSGKSPASTVAEFARLRAELIALQ